MATRKNKAASKGQRTLLQVGMPDMAAHKAEIKALQNALLDKGFNPGAADGVFGLGTQSAVMAFQRSEGLLADGVAGPRTLAELNQTAAPPLASVIDLMTPAAVSQMFPHTPLANIKRNLPFVLTALSDATLHDRLIVLAALSTIRAETESFEPVAEGQSRYNTSPDPAGHAFDLYDSRKDLGNKGPPDGERFRGRGYVQLTGRANYTNYSKVIGLKGQLIAHPELASDPAIAGKLLAAFLKDKERPLKEALLDWDFAGARRLVNGGSHGLDRFVEAYKTGIKLTA
ncbi:MAG: peptidoglycan-binding protein [Betaproteobacteria bacterium]|nr:peptidoglycan-binding protein [Betaproteobacteria bacterium]